MSIEKNHQLMIKVLHAFTEQDDNIMFFSSEMIGIIEVIPKSVTKATFILKGD